MALNAPRAWLITYDITCPRRLVRLHRFLCKHALPVQYSVFHYQGSAARLGQLMQQIESRIDSDSDDVRAYPLPEDPQIDLLGRGSLPADSRLLSSTVPSLDKLLHAARR